MSLNLDVLSRAHATRGGLSQCADDGVELDFYAFFRV